MILLGMYVINPSQVYVEVLWKGVFEGSYLDFWFGPYLNNGYAPFRMTPTWDHLWFLLYLLAYALPLAAIFAFRKRAEPKAIGLDWLVVVPGLWLALTNILVMEVQPVTHAFVNDWANHLRWVGIYAAGVTCAAQPHFWEALRTHRRAFLFAGLVLLGLYLVNLFVDFAAWDATVYALLSGFYGWIAVLVLAGFAAEYCNRNSRALAYLTDAVLPIYVFHQPIMLVFAYWLFPLSLPVPVEALLLIVVTGTGSVLAYEIFARRTRVLRFLFGLKPVPRGFPPAPAGTPAR